MFGLFQKRRGRPRVDVAEELAAIRLERERTKTALLKAMAGNPATFGVAVAALFPGAAKLLRPDGVQQGDDYKALVFEMLKANMNRNPLMEGIKALSMLRSAKADLADLVGGDDQEVPESDHLAVQIMSTPAATEFARAFAPAAADFVRQVQAQAVRAPSPHSTVIDMPAARPAMVQPQQEALDPNAVLELLQTRPPDEAAAVALQLAGRYPDLAQVLQVLLSLPEAAVEPTLQVQTRHPQWGPVASWLLQNPEWRAAFLAELLTLARNGAEHQPEAAVGNGHRHGGMGL